MAEHTFETHSEEETKKIAKEIVSRLSGGTCLCLFGDLGAGKTTFTQGVGEFFGIERIVSPTYIIVRQYSVNNSDIIKRLYHVDLYRLKSWAESRSFDLQEIWNDQQGLTVIEWPERLEGNLPEKRLEIYFHTLASNTRKIIVNSFL